MKKLTTGERINISVTAFCLLIIGAMAIDMLAFAPAIAREDGVKPPELNEVRIVDKQTGSVTLKEEYIASVIGGYMPAGLPKDNVKVSIQQTGEIYVGALADRKDLEDMLASYIGMKEKLFLKLLPRQFELGLTFMASPDGESGLLTFVPKAFTVNGMDLSVDILPTEVTRAISDGINSAILSSGFYFTQIVIKDGEVELVA